MNFLFFIFSVLIIQVPMEIFDFHAESDLSNWLIVDDVVMGGRSDGSFTINENGSGVFSGMVSIENNGGFSSVRYQFPQTSILDHKLCLLRLKGDGKNYQFRVKSERYDTHAYVHKFKTNNDWQVIEIPLAEMYPTFRGKTLDMPNYPAKIMEEIRFLIGNKQNESFVLEIDWIKLK